MGAACLGAAGDKLLQEQGVPFGGRQEQRVLVRVEHVVRDPHHQCGGVVLPQRA